MTKKTNGNFRIYYFETAEPLLAAAATWQVYSFFNDVISEVPSGDTAFVLQFNL